MQEYHCYRQAEKNLEEKWANKAHFKGPIYEGTCIETFGDASIGSDFIFSSPLVGIAIPLRALCT